MYAILGEQGQLRHWYQLYELSTTFAAAILPPSKYKHMHYADRAAAERDVEILRANNARDVERTKRRRKHKYEPITFPVVPVDEGAGP